MCLAGTLESFIRLCGLHRCQSPSKDSLWGKSFDCFTVTSLFGVHLSYIVFTDIWNVIVGSQTSCNGFIGGPNHITGTQLSTTIHSHADYYLILDEELESFFFCFHHRLPLVASIWTIV